MIWLFSLLLDSDGVKNFALETAEGNYIARMPLFGAETPLGARERQNTIKSRGKIRTALKRLLGGLKLNCGFSLLEQRLKSSPQNFS